MKMKLSLLTAIALGTSALSAAEVTVEPPLVSMKKEWNDGSMTGKNTHAMYVAGKKYPDCWSYWYADSGITPETAILKPLNAVDPDFVAGTFWAKYTPILTAGFNAKRKNPKTKRKWKKSSFAQKSKRTNFTRKSACRRKGF